MSSHIVGQRTPRYKQEPSEAEGSPAQPPGDNLHQIDHRTGHPAEGRTYDGDGEGEGGAGCPVEGKEGDGGKGEGGRGEGGRGEIDEGSCSRNTLTTTTIYLLVTRRADYFTLQLHISVPPLPPSLATYPDTVSRSGRRLFKQLLSNSSRPSACVDAVVI